MDSRSRSVYVIALLLSMTHLFNSVHAGNHVTNIVDTKQEGAFSQQSRNEKLLVVVIPSHNNAEWYENNLSSIFMQDYTNYYILYVDDCSSDGTYELVKEYIRKQGQEDRVILLRNPKKTGHLYNHIQAVYMAEPHAIIINIDGDDWLRLDEHKRTDIFKMINKIYDDPNVWLTYGSYYRYPYGNVGTCKSLPLQVIKDASYREFEWVSSHLRTFYGWLFRQINVHDLFYSGDNADFRGKLWPAAADLAFMFPMLEMAAGRFFYVPDVIYAYNRANPLNLCEGDWLAVQNSCARLVRNKQRYAPLDQSLFWHYMKDYFKVSV
jgi:glycosyltransferase involved in cell wall biosynthesis